MMRNFQGLVILAMAAVLAPAAVCQTQPATTDTQTEPQVRVIPPEDQPTKEELAKLFEAMQLKQQMAAMLKSMPAIMQQQVTEQIKSVTANLPSGSSMTQEQTAALEKFTKKYTEKAITLYPADEMIADMSSVYQRHLSREDVAAMTEFYTSPAGQHLLGLTPVVMKEYLPLVMGRMQERTKALTDEMMKDLKDTMPGLVSPAEAAPAK